jgi:hypothetical protein
VRNHILNPDDPVGIGWFDLDGNGTVNSDDLLVVRRKLGTRV